MLTGYLRTNVRRLLAEDVRFRLAGEDAVHQMRVAARRLRSALRVFGPLVDAEWSDPLREELKWFADRLAASRDAEVLLARLIAELDLLPPEMVIGPVRARLEQFVGGDLAAGLAAAEQLLGDERYLTLLERLVDAAWSPRLTDIAAQPAQVVLPDLVRAVWRRLGVGVARVRETGAPGDYHWVRIAAKRARYAADAVEPAFGRPAERFARQISRVQEVLGEHQDAVTAQATLVRLAHILTRPFGRVHLWFAARARGAPGRSCAREFAVVWPEVARRRYRAWLTT